MARVRVGSTVMVVACAFALSACWPAPGQNPDRTAYNGLESDLTAETVGELDDLWSAATGPSAVGDPVVAGAHVVAATGTRLHGVAARTGALEWTWMPDAPIPDFGAVSDPFVVDDRVLVGFGIGNLGGHWSGAWVDPDAGTTVDSAPVAGLVQGVRGTRAVTYSAAFGSGTPVLISFRVDDHQSGTGGTGGPLSILSGGAGGGPLALTLGTTHAFHAGLGTIPPATPTGTWTQGVAVRAFPVTGGSNTCGPPGAPGFACATWTTAVGGTPTAVVIGPGEQVVYVGTSAGAVTALDAATGAQLWTAAVGAAVAHPPALAGGVLYVPTADGDLVAVAADGCGAATCEPSWLAPTGTAAISTQPAVAGPADGAVVFVGTAAGDVLAFAAGGCGETICDSPLWSTSTGTSITGGPAVSNGRLYVGTLDGRLIAYARAAP